MPLAALDLGGHGGTHEPEQDMTHHDQRHEPQLGAVFAERAAAEQAVAELGEIGLADEHLGVAFRQPDTYVLEHDAGRALGHGPERPVAVGAPLGAVAGMAILTQTVPGAGAIGVGGLLAAGAVTGALAGGFWGGYLGLTGHESALEDEWDWERTRLQPGEVLIVVCRHPEPGQASEILRRYGGSLVASPLQVS
jgi:hypothetical protein